MRTLTFGPDGVGKIVYLILEDQRRLFAWRGGVRGRQVVGLGP